MMRMHHPGLDAAIDVPDDPGCIAAHVESGWVEAPEDTVQHHPALAPGEQAPDEAPGPDDDPEPEQPASKKTKPEGDRA